MWRRILYPALVLAALVPAASLSRALLAEELPTPPAPGKDAWTLHQFVQLQVVAGRLVVTQPGGGSSQSRSLATGTADSPEYQQLQLQARQPNCLLRYEARRSGGTLTLSLCEKRKLIIAESPAASSDKPSVQFVQDSLGQAKLTIGSKQPETYTAGSFWRLLLLYPEVCRKHFLPLLAELQPEWNVASDAHDLRLALYELGASGDLSAQCKEWQSLVGDLASNSFQVRQRADRQLRAGGLSAAAWLKGLDHASFSAEQRSRIAGMIRDLQGTAPDTAARAAASLAFDHDVWMTLLENEQQEHREIAAAHLARLVRQPVAFDASAPAERRSEQVSSLRKKYSQR